MSSIWDNFEKIPGKTAAKCLLCSKEYSYKTTITNLRKHLSHKHLSAYRNVSNQHRRVETSPTSVSVVEQGIQSNSDEEQNSYTEIIYLEDEGNTMDIRKSDPTAGIKKRVDTRPTALVVSYDEVDVFGKYVSSLLKQLPIDLCTQLQMDVINMIMNAKLNKMEPADSEPAFM